MSTLAVLLVNAYKPPVSLSIAEPNEDWRSILQRMLGDIPHLQIQAPENPDPVSQAQELEPDIVILSSWKSFGVQVPLLRKISLHTRMDMIIGVLTGYGARNVIREGPDVDFVLNKTSPVDVLRPMVQDWVEGAQIRKRKALLQ